MGDRQEDQTLTSAAPRPSTPATEAPSPDTAPQSPNGHGDDGPGQAGAGNLAPEPSATPQAETSSPACHPDISAAAASRRKRSLDIGLIVVALPILLPLCLIIALLVACTSRGGVLFFQQRIGLNGKQFRLVKFRTMRTDAEAHLRSNPALWETYVSNDFKLPAEMETRVTAIGRVLRRSSLDELPQLLNVLRGQMSLVGPRPIVPEELDKYGQESHYYLSVRPGITGIWQVNGRSGVGYPERITLDRDYTESWSFWQDVRILLRTPIAVLSRRGAH